MLNYLKIYGAFGILAGAVSNHTISQAHPKHLKHHQQVLSRESVQLGAGVLLGGGAAGAIGAYELGAVGMSDYGGGADVKATVANCMTNQTQLGIMFADWYNDYIECDAQGENQTSKYGPCPVKPSELVSNPAYANAAVAVLISRAPAIPEEFSKLDGLDPVSEEYQQFVKKVMIWQSANVKYEMVWKRGENATCAGGLTGSNVPYMMLTNLDFTDGTFKDCPFFNNSVGDLFTFDISSTCGEHRFPFCATYNGNLMYTDHTTVDGECV